MAKKIGLSELRQMILKTIKENYISERKGSKGNVMDDIYLGSRTMDDDEYEYTVTVEYDITSGRPATMTDPEEHSEIEILSAIDSNGNDISNSLTQAEYDEIVEQIIRRHDYESDRYNVDRDRFNIDENQEDMGENPKIIIRKKYDERNPNQGKESYSVNYQFKTAEGQEIEIEGTLKPYHTGRDYEYEFEPGWFAEDADSDYYDEHWEEIEEQILEKFYQTDKFELDENEEGGGIERVYLNRRLSDYFEVPYTDNDGYETIIYAGTLKEKGDWDKEHLALFDKYAGMDLTLKGTGLGWWKIVQALRENKNTKNMNIRKLIRETLEKKFNVNESYDHWKATNPNDNHVNLPNDYYDVLELDVYRHKDGVVYVYYKTRYGSGKTSLENLYKHFGDNFDFDINNIFEDDGKTLKLDAKIFIEQMIEDSIVDGSWYKDNLDEGFDNYLIKEDINVGDTVMNNGNFYKVISKPFTAVDNGLAQFAADNDGASPPKDVDLRSYYTAIRVKNIDTGNESKGDINYFKKINPEDIEGLRQAKLAQDAADKIKKEKDDAERKARWAKEWADMQAKEKERISSKGDIELAKKMIADWGNNIIEIDYEIKSYNQLEVNCILNLDDNLDNDYYVEFIVDYDLNYSGDPEWPDVDIEFALDLVNIYKGKDLVYKGKAEFLPVFDKEIKPWLEYNKELHEKADEVFSDWNRD